MLVGRRPPVENLDDVASADDLLIPGPGGDLPVRIYRPHGDSDAARARGGVLRTAAASCCATWTRTTASAGRWRGTPRRWWSRWTTGSHRSIARRPPLRTCSPRGAGSIAHADDLGVDPQRVLVAGDSAGGNLAAVTALMCREHGGRDARRAGADLSRHRSVRSTRELSQVRQRDTSTPRSAMQWYWRQYLDGHDAVPAVSGGAGVAPTSHEGLPPAIVVTAGFDVLQSEGASYAEKLRAANVACGASGLPGPVPRVRDDHAVLGGGRRPGSCCGPICARLLAIDVEAA